MAATPLRLLLPFLVFGLSVLGVTADAQRPTSADTRRAVHAAVQRVLERGLADSAFPGAFAIVGTARGIVAQHGVGRIDWKPSARRPDERTIWDLASLTKVVGLTSAIIHLYDQGRLDLDAPVQRYLPDWTGPGKERVTVRHLLTHTAGLPAFRQYYRQATTPEEARRLFFATPLDTLPGVRTVYSDIGAWLLGQMVERISKLPLDQYLERNVFRPLGMRETMYRPAAALRVRIPPTEIDPWRGRHVHGEVHDENAFALGGVSGHAGLFGSAHDLARLARAYLNGGQLDGTRVFSQKSISYFTRRPDSASSRALGWDTPTGRNSAGRHMSARAFGHTGFTGTSLWIDPESDVFVILLTNRVNPTRDNAKIGGVRSGLADAIMTALGAAVTEKD